MQTPLFGISTHLFHEQRLDREHLVEIAAHGFEAVELFATRGHFDYRDPAAVAALGEWLEDTRLAAQSMHAPIVDAIRDGAWVGSYSIASSDEARRRQAIEEITAALQVAGTIPFRVLVLHVGMPDAERPRPDDNQPAAARRSIEELFDVATPLGVQLALEIIPNRLSTPAELVTLIEEKLELPELGICLDTGHAHLAGDVADAIDVASGYLVTTHLHDNKGTRDDHLVPFAGTIDWPSVVMTLAKVGFDGALMFEVAGGGDPAATLARAARARERLDALVAEITFDFGGE